MTDSATGETSYKLGIKNYSRGDQITRPDDPQAITRPVAEAFCSGTAPSARRKMFHAIEFLLAGPPQAKLPDGAGFHCGPNTLGGCWVADASPPSVTDS